MTAPVQEPSQGRINQALEFRSRQLFRRPNTTLAGPDQGASSYVFRPLYSIWVYASTPEYSEETYFGITGHGSTVYVSHDSDAISAYNVHSGERLWFTDLSGVYWTSFLAATATHVFASNETGDVCAFDASDGSIVGTLSSPDPTTYLSEALCVHEATNSLYVSTRNGGVASTGNIWKVDISDPTAMSIVDTATALHISSTNNALKGICVSNDGSRVYSCVYQVTAGPVQEAIIHAIDTDTMSVAWSNTTDTHLPDSLAITPDDNTLWVYGESGTYVLFNLNCSDGSLIDYHLFNGPITLTYSNPETSDKYQSLAITPDGRYLVLVDCYGGAFVYLFDTELLIFTHVFDWYTPGGSNELENVAIVDGKICVNNVYSGSGQIYVMGTAPVERVTESPTIADSTEKPLWATEPY